MMNFSSIGCKAVMAITGLLLFGFVVAHMLGNLQIFLGRDVLNGYAEQIKHLPGLLWTARLGLLAVFVVHIAAGIHLVRQNRAARPVQYVVEETIAASGAARSMLLTGLVILAFVVYHLMHFTLHWTDPQFGSLVQTMPDGATRPDVHAMVVAGFSNPAVTFVYIVAQLLLGLHLSHGLSSLFQTLGVRCARCQGVLEYLGPVGALVIILGNCSIPVAVLTGLVTAASGTGA